LNGVPNIVCEVWGLPLPGWTQKEGEPLLCPACRDGTYAFDRARSFAVYEDAVVRAILLLKFEQIEPLGGWFAERLAEVVNAEGARLAADVVVPVPLHCERERERRTTKRPYSPSPGKRLRLPHKAVLLMRTRARPGKQVLSLEKKMGVGAWRFCHTSRQPS